MSNGTSTSLRGQAETDDVPMSLAVEIDGIPSELAELPQWLIWKYELRKGKWAKMPYSPTTGRLARVNDASTWGTISQAWGCYESNEPFVGIGFVLTEADNYAVIDLDDCRNPETGEIESWAEEIFASCGDTYVEVSPSGTGLHIFCRGIKPSDRCRKGKKEVYSHGRYIAVTGVRLNGTFGNILDCTPQLGELVESMAEDNAMAVAAESQNSSRRESPSTLADDDVKATMFAAKNGEKIRRLWEGDLSDYGGDHSAADQAFHNIAAFFTGRNAEQMDRLHRQSGLMREKWNRADYRERTIQKAIDDCQESYSDRNVLGNFPSERRKHSLTDLGNSERMVAHHGKYLRYIPRWNKWIYYSRAAWKHDDIGEVERRAQETARSIFHEVAKERSKKKRTALLRWAIKSESASAIKAMLHLARSQPGIPILPESLDRDPWLLNVANGTVDLRNGELLPHRRDDYITKCSPASYLPANEVEAPLWLDFLHGVFLGNDQLIGYFQRLSGYAITGSVREQVLPILYGTGANGKSTALEAITQTLGNDYTSKAESDLLIAKRGDTHPTGLADLHGRRLVISSETDGGRRLSEAMVKRVTGDGRIKARRMREDFWEFEPTHKIFLVTNHKPEVRGRDQGIWRRLQLIPFNARFEGRDADPDLPEKLNVERDGILRWLVDGCLKWQRDGLSPPDIVQAATQEYRESQDVLAEFLRERCIQTEDPGDVRIKSSDLFAAYRQWVDHRGEKPMGVRSFGEAIAEAGISKVKSNGVWYPGLTLAPDP